MREKVRKIGDYTRVGSLPTRKFKGETKKSSPKGEVSKKRLESRQFTTPKSSSRALVMKGIVPERRIPMNDPAPTPWEFESVRFSFLLFDSLRRIPLGSFYL